jgi:hypothetical protein
LRELGWRRSGARFGAYRGDYLPARIVEVHFAAGQLAMEAQNLSLLIELAIGAAIAVLVGLVSGKGMAANEWHEKRDMQKPYPITPSLPQCRENGKPAQISCSSIAWGPRPWASS